MNNIYIIVGSSGAGKGSIVKRLADNKSLKLTWAKTATTRPKREDDKSFSKHVFLSKKEFIQKIKKGEILEYNLYNGHYYGTLKESVDNILKKSNALMEIDINGAINLKKIYKDRVKIIFIYATQDELKSRLHKRGMPDSVINQRLKIAERELNRSRKSDFIIHNRENKLNKTINAIIRYLKEMENK